MRTLGSTVSLPFRIERITGLLQWMFPFSSLVLVNVSTEISLPGEHSSSQMLLSAQKPSGGLCLAGLITGTLTEWKLLLPSWLASSSQLWLRLKRGAQRRTGSRQILGRLLSSTEIVDITSLRGSGSANPFSCGSPFELGALPPLTRLEKQRQTSVEIVLQSRQQRRLKQTAVLGCVAKPPAFKRISTMVCPFPFGLLSDIFQGKGEMGSESLLLFSGLHRVTLQVRLRIWPGCGETPSSVRSIDGERSFQHVPMFPLPLRCLTPPLRLLSLMPLVCLTFILQLWMPFRKLRLEKPLAPTSFLLSFLRQAAARFVCFLPDCFPRLVITELR